MGLTGPERMGVYSSTSATCRSVTKINYASRHLHIHGPWRRKVIGAETNAVHAHESATQLQNRLIAKALTRAVVQIEES